MPDEKNLKNKVISSLMWKFLERGGVQVIQFVISIIIARILSPESYGVIALIIVFINIASVFVQSGLGTALIQKKDADSTDFSSIFFYSLLIATVLYIVLFCSAPYIAAFYEMPKLTNVLRIMSLTLFPGAFNSIQNAFVSREMKFKKQFYSSMGAVIVSGTVGILMAYQNYEEWALVFQQLSYQMVVCVIMWFTVKWRPVLKFSYEKSKALLKYGSKLLAANLIDTLYHNLSSLVIGKIFSAEKLAFFNKGKQFPLILIDNVDGTIQSVMLPAYSSNQDDTAQVKALVRRAIVTSTYLAFPAMIGLACIAQPLILLMLTDKWLPCVPFVQIYCLICALFPMHTANLQAINALGHSTIYLKLMTIKRIIGIIFLVISIVVFRDIVAIACSVLAVEIIATFMNAYPNKRLLSYSISEQMKDILPSVAISIVMGIAIYSILLFSLPAYLTIMIQVVVGICVYFGLSILFKLECFYYLLNIVKSALKSNKYII